ncbi:hypothetical protein, partial [Enterobacter intestinihominis]
YGVVYKPWEEISLYANHTEPLHPGETAPRSANNYGQSTGIVPSKQNQSIIHISEPTRRF